MSEALLKHSKPRSIEQLVSPKHLPEAGFQSYEMLKNNAASQKLEFLAGTIRNPSLSYPHFESVQRMDEGILNLQQAIDEVQQVETDQQRADIITTSLEFRMAEMEYVKLLARIDFVTKEGRAHSEVAELVEEARELGEQLYGVPEQEIVDSALGEVWSQLSEKTLHPSGQKIYDELHDGFSLDGAWIPPLPQPDTHNQLPRLDDSSLTWAGEIILEDNAELEAYFDEFWDHKVAEHGPEYMAHPADIVEAYEGAFKLLDPANDSGVGVMLDPETSALSWESPLMAVKVGGQRAPIRSAATLFQKFLHEGKGHGGRAINGLKTKLPVLGTGLYTNTARPDYLTFEEGFCTTIEEAVSGKEPKWDGAKLGHYINISLANSGSDFRSVFETAWRYRLLMSLDDPEQEVTEELIEKHQNAAYAATVRIFRGTPTALSEQYPDIKPLTFNKDLAYLNGRVLAMKYIRELYENNDEAGLMRLFQAKYDPTIPEQKVIVEDELQRVG